MRRDRVSGDVAVVSCSQDGTYVYFDSEKLLGVMIELLHSDKKE